MEFSAVGAFGLHETEIADGTIDPAVDAEFDAIRTVVGRAILESEGDILDENFLFVGFAVVVVIDEHTEVRWVEKVEAVLVPKKAARGIDVFDEFLHFIGMAVVVEVADSEDAAAVRAAVQRAVFVRGDEERAVGSGGDEDGVVYGRGGGEDG